MGVFVYLPHIVQWKPPHKTHKVSSIWTVCDAFVSAFTIRSLAYKINVIYLRKEIVKLLAFDSYVTYSYIKVEVYMCESLRI